MTTSQSEAEALAHKVSSYWAVRGYAPEVWTIPELVTASPTSHRLSWTVRSDMVGGWPKGAPCPIANFNSGTQRDSRAGIPSLAGIRRPETRIESVARSQSLWRRDGMHG